MLFNSDIFSLSVLPHFHFEKAEVKIQMVVNEMRFVMLQYNTSFWSMYACLCFAQALLVWLNKASHFPALGVFFFKHSFVYYKKEGLETNQYLDIINNLCFILPVVSIKGNFSVFNWTFSAQKDRKLRLKGNIQISRWLVDAWVNDRWIMFALKSLEKCNKINKLKKPTPLGVVYMQHFAQMF